MKSSMIASTLAICATLTSAAPSLRRRQVTTSATATLQIEIAPDTFTSDTEITLGTVLDLNDTPIEVLSIGVESVNDVTCLAFDQSTVVGTFSTAQNVFFSTLQTVAEITCDFTKRSSTPTAIIHPTISASTVAPMTSTGISTVSSTVSAPAGTRTTVSALTNTLAEATLTLEIEPDTFIQQDVTVGTQADTDIEVISATVATVKGAKNANNVVCVATANDSSDVVGAFSLTETAVFNKGKLVDITSITCEEMTA
jgi:hypothetical protein